MEGLRADLCGELECIQDSSKHCVAFTAVETSDVAGVRQEQLNPQATPTGTAVPEAPSPAPEVLACDSPLCATMHFLEAAPSASIGGLLRTVEATVTGGGSGFGDEEEGAEPVEAAPAAGGAPVSTAPAPRPTVAFNRSAEPSPTYEHYGCTLMLSYPHLFFGMCPALDTQKGPLTSTMMRYLLELGHRRFTYAPFLYDVANQRAIADANAQAKARVQYMSKEKVAWLVDTFSSREGLRLLQEAQGVC